MTRVYWLLRIRANLGGRALSMCQKPDREVVPTGRHCLRASFRHECQSGFEPPHSKSQPAQSSCKQHKENRTTDDHTIADEDSRCVRAQKPKQEPYRHVTNDS